MTTTVKDLREWLEQFDDDVEVRFASQPRWAFEYSVELSESAHQHAAADTIGAVYLAEGTQIGYLPHTAALAVGWAKDEEDETA